MRYIGLLFIFCAFSGFGIFAGFDLKRRERALLQLLRFFSLLKGEISYAITALPEAFLHLSERSETPFSTFFAWLSEQMEEQSGQSFSELWGEGIRLHFKQIPFHKEELDELRRLGDGLGYLDKEMQLKQLERFLEQIEREREKSAREIETKVRIYRCIGIMGGLCIVIVLI